MDGRLQNLGFAANYSSNVFKILGNSMPIPGTGSYFRTDTTLRLNSPGSSSSYMPGLIGTKRKWGVVDGSLNQHVGSSLSLGIGHSPSSSDSKGSSATVCNTMSSAKETDEESSMDLELDFSLHLGNEKVRSLKRPAISMLTALDLQPKVDLELSLSTVLSESGITSVDRSSTSVHSGMEVPQVIGAGAQNADEVSTSCLWKPGAAKKPFQTSLNPGATTKPFQTSPNPGVAAKPLQTSPNPGAAAKPFQASLNPGAHFLFKPVPNKLDLIPTVPDISSSILTTPTSSACNSAITHRQQHRSSNSKTCQVEGCGKGARGASGRCISHGGGRRCQRTGCHKGAEGRTVYCKAHGGGRRCEYLGCTKSAEGRTDFCIAHGGGRRCSHGGCTRAARGKSGLCIRHGGGKRCQKENCTKSAEGLSGLCISHGGGRRCQATGCTKGAQGSTMFCKAHGGGKRCTAPGCTKGAEGSTPYCKGHGGGKRCAFQGGGQCTKSVHGGTSFCVAHGGGKRCAMPECTKSARGRTDYCVRHGGGKRCKFSGCGKSAQGSTDFCKAHGGGKRCSWGHPGSLYGREAAGPCNSFSRGKTGLCALHSGLVQDKRVHGGVTLGTIVQEPKLGMLEKMSEVDEMNVDDVMANGSIATTVSRSGSGSKHGGSSIGQPSVIVPEGRVHGGSLMALLAGGSDTATSNIMGSDSSLPVKLYMMPKNWM